MEDLLCLSYGGPKAKSNARVASPAADPDDLSRYLSPSTGQPLYSRLLRDEIEAADRRLLEDARRARQIGGTTLLVSVLDGSDLWVANVGDCRGVMGSGVADVTSLSYDHKPSQVGDLTNAVEYNVHNLCAQFTAKRKEADSRCRRICLDEWGLEGAGETTAVVQFGVPLHTLHTSNPR